MKASKKLRPIELLSERAQGALWGAPALLIWHARHFEIKSQYADPLRRFLRHAPLDRWDETVGDIGACAGCDLMAPEEIAPFIEAAWPHFCDDIAERGLEARARRHFLRLGEVLEQFPSDVSCLPRAHAHWIQRKLDIDPRAVVEAMLCLWPGPREGKTFLRQHRCPVSTLKSIKELDDRISHELRLYSEYPFLEFCYKMYNI